MRVWTKPELIVENYVLSQYTIADCTVTVPGYNISCTSTGGGLASHDGNNKDTRWYGDKDPGFISETDYENDLAKAFIELHTGRKHNLSINQATGTVVTPASA